MSILKKKALIFGISGQDGSYLSEYLLQKGYEVHGVVRRHSVPENQTARINHIFDKVNLYYGDLCDPPSIESVLRKVMPDEIYNLAAQSHVRVSFDVPQYTMQVNSNGVLNLLEAFRKVCPDARFYQASSSEMFGNSVDEDGYQREGTPFVPVSPYACSKVNAHNICNNYRESYKLFICCGILFNHESPRRASTFVTTKVVKGVLDIKNGKKDKLELGDIDSSRDWGHSKDYVRSMHMMLNNDKPGDWVVSTGETHTVRELCEYTFKKFGLDYREYVTQNPKYLRPHELKYLKGDSSKIREELKWKPEYSFESLIDEMISELDV